jgi:hypothetical protein
MLRTFLGRRILCWAIVAACSVGIVIAAAISLWENDREIRNASMRELAALQSNDRVEAIMFGSRKRMLQVERNYFLAGFGIGALGLLGAIFAVRRAAKRSAA